MSETNPTNEIGNVYGRWTVIAWSHRAKGRDFWLCRCDCGTEKATILKDLRKGKSKSCGCLNMERITIHGQSESATWRSWKSMNQRCSNPNSTGFKNYGGRGVLVCDRWRDFPAFFADMGERPPGMTLERRNNNLGYSPENCLWATRKQQSLNRRDNHLLTFREQTLPLSAWAEKIGFSPEILRYRIRAGWTIKRALLTVPNSRSRGYDRKRHSDWCSQQSQRVRPQ